MAGTRVGDSRKAVCDDCGEKGFTFFHDGHLVPEGVSGHFCSFCLLVRGERALKGQAPLPLGVKPPGIPEELRDKAIKVTIKDGSVCTLSSVDGSDRRDVSYNGGLSFRGAKVMDLSVGRGFFLKLPDNSTFLSSPVVSMEAI
ncbi:MAG: hypothetical protein WC514_02130 [Candidatus Paceibacterota bacterium]